jgi:PIN domain nuclease of toxin-antitoxin system
VNLLLDTHSLLWFLNEDPQLVPNAKALIEDSSNRKFLSIASCWEIAIKIGLNKLDLGEPVSTFLPRELLVNKFDLLHIELVHALHVEKLPRHHRDPFDRLLVSQSIIEKIAIVSSDEKFDSYGVVRLWK